VQGHLGFPWRVLGAAALLSGGLPGCGPNGAEPHTEPAIIFDPKKVEKSFVEVVPCRHSHEHDLRYVRSYADPTSAQIFKDCVLLGPPTCRHAGFPKGSLLVKYEYETEACDATDLVSYTATLRLADDSFPEGLDWHWQRATPELKVTDDGAPPVCLNCHIEHCSPPNGFDMHCRPD